MSSSSEKANIALPLGLESKLAHRVFPERSMLMVTEVAKALRIDHKQVVALINEGLLGAIEITGRGNKSSREHWRIPVASYDDYIRRRSNLDRSGDATR